MEGRATQARFCTESCRTKAARPRPPATCKRCDGPVGDRHGNARFCSPRCAKAFKDAAHYARHRERIREQHAEYAAKHKEEKRVQDAAYYSQKKDDPEFRQRRAEYGRRFYLENREKMAAYGRWYRETDPERWAAKNKAWLAANPDKARNYRAARRAREMEAFVEEVDRVVVWERDGGICHICQQHADVTSWHLDHVVPLAKGGKHSYANVAVSHPSCNQSKGAKLLS